MSVKTAEIEVEVHVDTWVTETVQFTEDDLLEALESHFGYVPRPKDEVEGELTANKRLRAFLLGSIDNPMGSGWLAKAADCRCETVNVPQLWLDRLHEALADWVRQTKPVGKGAGGCA